MTQERPIPMIAPSVRAILAGSMAQTRRVIKNTLKVCDECFNQGVPHNREDLISDGAVNIAGGVFGTEPYLRVAYCEHTDRDGGRLRCPYGAIGDHLWVKETFGCFCHNSMQPMSGCELVYRSTYDGLDYPLSGWRPSIFMPRWASRITLEITNIRVERLQQISDEDAAAEGVQFIEGNFPLLDVPQPRALHYHAYAHLWDSINGAGAWDKNPWVFVIDFKRIKP